MDAEDRREFQVLAADIAALKANQQHSMRDREMIRLEIHAAEQRVLGRLNEVDEECRDFRRKAAEVWDRQATDLADRDEKQAKKQEERDKLLAERDERMMGRRASVTVAWIGGAFILITGLVQTLGPLFGIG